MSSNASTTDLAGIATINVSKQSSNQKVFRSKRTGKKRKCVTFAPGTAKKDGDSVQRLHKIARSLSRARIQALKTRERKPAKLDSQIHTVPMQDPGHHAKRNSVRIAEKKRTNK